MIRACALLVLLLAAGCGYSTDSLLPEGVQTVAVESFGNETTYRRAEILFTEELRRQFLRRGGGALRGPSEADAIVRGRILEIPRVTFVEDRNDRILEGGVVVSVEVRMEDARTGRGILPPFVVSRRAEYLVPRGEDLQSAIDEAVMDAARDAFDRLCGEPFLRERAASGRSTPGS
jgi:hypothetical protein